MFFTHVSYPRPAGAGGRVANSGFLAAAGVRRLPLVGAVARALGTVFVDRGRPDSRAQARGALAQAVRQFAGAGRRGARGPHRPGRPRAPVPARGRSRWPPTPAHPSCWRPWRSSRATRWRGATASGVVQAFWRLCARTTPVVARLSVLAPAQRVRPGDGAPRGGSRRGHGPTRAERLAAADAGGLRGGNVKIKCRPNRLCPYGLRAANGWDGTGGLPSGGVRRFLTALRLRHPHAHPRTASRPRS